MSYNLLSDLENKFFEKIIPSIIDNSISTDDQSYCLQFFIARKLPNNYEIKFDFKHRNLDYYTSGGYGKWLNINFIKNLKFFQNYMSSMFSIDYTFVGKRTSRSRINYLEHIPNITEQTIELDNINLLNTFIQISVADFIFKYEWKNIYQIFQETLTENSDKSIKINPEMLPISTLMNFSVEWHFNN